MKLRAIQTIQYPDRTIYPSDENPVFEEKDEKEAKRLIAAGAAAEVVEEKKK